MDSVLRLPLENAMQRNAPRLWGAISVPWLVSANVHVAVLLFLLSTLAPLDRGGVEQIEMEFGQDETLVTELDDSWELAYEDPLAPAALDVASLQELVPELNLPTPSSELAAGLDHSAALAAGVPAEENLLAGAALSAHAIFEEAPGLHGARGEGDGPAASFFGTTAYGNRFVFVLDMSGSMEKGGDGTAQGNRFRRAAEELATTVERMTPDQGFYVYLFSTVTLPLFNDPPASPRWRPASEENKRLLRLWLSTIQPSGGTDPRPAIQLAMELRPDALFLLSDGRFNGKEKKILGGLIKTNPSVARTAQAANKRRVPIHSFAFEDVLACKSMQDLALKSGGVYRFIPPLTREEGGRAAELDEDIQASNLLKTAESLEGAGRVSEALEQYRQVQSRFPNTQEAEEAAQRWLELLGAVAEKPLDGSGAAGL